MFYTAWRVCPTEPAGRVITPAAACGGDERANEDVGLLLGVGVGVGPDEPLPVRLAADPVSDGLADGLEVSVGEPDGSGEEESVGVGPVGVGVVGVGDGEDVVGVADGDDVPLSVEVGVADGRALVVGLGLPDGEADGQGAEVSE